MNESTILLVAMEKCIVRLPILYFWFDQFHLQYFDFCIQHPALFRETYYFINTIINSQPTTEWLKLPNHFYQCKRNKLIPVWKNFMALASARPDCLVSSSGADYKAWSGAGQNCNVFVRSAASQRLVRH